MRRALTVVIVLFAVLGASGCRTEAPQAGEARLSVASGALASVRLPNASGWTSGRSGAILPAGAQVRAEHGEVSLDLIRGVHLDLVRGTELTVGRRPGLRRGELLIDTAAAGTPSRLTIEAAGSMFTARPASLVRVHRNLDAGVAVYQGGADVTSAGRDLTVPALRTAAVPALGLLPDRPLPVRPDASDPWDQRYLGTALDLTAELDAGSNGFSAEAPSAALDELVLLVGGAPVPGASPLPRRRSGEQLVGAAIAAAGSTSGAAPSFEPRLRATLGFRDEGASWGIVTLDQAGANRARVVALVRRAIAQWVARAGGFGAPAGPPAVAAPVATDAASASPAASTVPAVRTGGSATAPPNPSTTPTAPAPAASPPTTSAPVSSPVPVPAVTAPTLPPTDTPIDGVVQLIGPTTSTAPTVGSALGG